ncbi:lipase [Vararia minispora EC-137]|uniref:Lipase n=1 Tax=Vararia minispora EC-137 TaxID=1314806 RepID=A0ACB8Q7V1_9AGAM|nr:lipase [Vararia minispora EC-137]
MLARLCIAATLLGASFGASLSAKRQSVTMLTTAEIDAFTQYTWFASAAYCSPMLTLAWNCGVNCNANAGFQPVASGGDGSSIQFWYVGFAPSLGEVIVAHQGTNTSSIVADLTDINIIMGTLNSTLFPGVPSSVKVHEGFRNVQEKTATTILADVRSALTAHSASKVTVVGHSLGGAISLIDAFYLSLQLPASVSVKLVSYGMPRVGNQAWASLLDASRVSITHINNREDPVPILPGMFLGFHHPAGEIHIQDSGAWDACPGDDNPSTLCIVGDVPTIFTSNPGDHDGPYNGVTISC